MAHYYFDMADAGTFYDEDGLVYKDDAEAKHQAMCALKLSFAADVVPSADSCQAFTILVSNAKREAIYSATLTVSGSTVSPERLERGAWWRCLRSHGSSKGAW